jgi:hypothetical protein
MFGPVPLAGHYSDTVGRTNTAIEPWMHFVAICSALITGVARLALDLEICASLQRLVLTLLGSIYSLGN